MNVNKAVQKNKTDLTLGIEGYYESLSHVAYLTVEMLRGWLESFLIYDAGVACFQSIDPERSYEHDVYDELLTQAEIQGNVNKVNSQYDNEMMIIMTMNANLYCIVQCQRQH